MSYPKTKKEAVERLIEKVEKGLAEGKRYGYIDVVAGLTSDCPLCRWASKDDGVDCDRCYRAFGKRLGYDNISYVFYCLGIKFGGILLDDYNDSENTSDAERRAFLTALLPVLKDMLSKMR